jgi:hypothetical protein
MVLYILTLTFLDSFIFKTCAYNLCNNRVQIIRINSSLLLNVRVIITTVFYRVFDLTPTVSSGVLTSGAGSP